LIKKIFYFFKLKLILEKGIGDWGLGIGNWRLGQIPNPQSPIPNPQLVKLNNKIKKYL